MAHFFDSLLIFLWCFSLFFVCNINNHYKEVIIQRGSSFLVSATPIISISMAAIEIVCYIIWDPSIDWILFSLRSSMVLYYYFLLIYFKFQDLAHLDLIFLKNIQSEENLPIFSEFLIKLRKSHKSYMDLLPISISMTNGFIFYIFPLFFIQICS